MIEQDVQDKKDIFEIGTILSILYILFELKIWN
jgi:hypothetical protein